MLVFHGLSNLCSIYSQFSFAGRWPHFIEISWMSSYAWTNRGKSRMITCYMGVAVACSCLTRVPLCCDKRCRHALWWMIHCRNLFVADGNVLLLFWSIKWWMIMSTRCSHATLRINQSGASGDRLQVHCRGLLQLFPLHLWLECHFLSNRPRKPVIHM